MTYFTDIYKAPLFVVENSTAKISPQRHDICAINSPRLLQRQARSSHDRLDRRCNLHPPLIQSANAPITI